MGFIYRIMFIVLAVLIPVSCILGAANIVYRMPDLYVYQFNKYQITDEVDLEMKDDDLGQFISDFMSGKKSDFAMVQEYRDREQSVFSTVEQLNMEHARGILNNTMFVMVGAALLTLLFSGIFLAKKMKPELRSAFKGGILVTIMMNVALLIAFSLHPVKKYLHGLIFIRPFGADDVLPQMLTGAFAQLSVIAVALVSLILLILLSSVVWRLTKPRRMFW